MTTDTKTSPWPVLDLRPISAEADRMLTVVSVETEYGERRDWLMFGEASLMPVENGQALRRWHLKGWMGRGATDESHDGAQILRIPLIGVTLARIDQHRCQVEAIIDPSIDDDLAKTDFRVPAVGWDPFIKGEMCTRCRAKDTKDHPITPYLPKHDSKLWALMRGKRVIVRMGAARQPYRHASG